MNLKQFVLYSGIAVGLGNTLLMLFLFYQIWVYGKANVHVFEPNLFILVLEIFVSLFGAFMMANILYNNKKFNVVVSE